MKIEHPECAAEAVRLWHHTVHTHTPLAPVHMEYFLLFQACESANRVCSNSCVIETFSMISAVCYYFKMIELFVLRKFVG